MPTQFFYSKKYSANGAPVSALSNLDYFALSRVVLPTPPYVLGFRTYIATLNQLKNYIINDIKSNIGNFVVNNSLSGNGTQNAPLGVNDSYLDGIYYKSKNWPFTQIGDPSDFVLPLSGSYLSVSYPYTNDPYPPTSIIEGNGDLRLLHHVTNGEDIRVVYAMWKNYRNTLISTMQITDVIYRPPGLLVNEFIHNVFPASDSAMVAEIHNENGFVEYGFIRINDTALADYHDIIRLGIQPITVLFNGRNYPTNTAIQLLRAATVMAAEVKGKNYIGVIMPVLAGQPQVCFAFAEVSDAGVVTIITNWSATNSEGQVIANTDKAIIYNKLETHDPADPDACFLMTTPEMYCNSATNIIGAAPFNRSSWTSSGDNRMVMVSQHYCQVSIPSRSAACHGQYYHVVDFDNRTVTPVPGRLTGRTSITVNASGALVHNGGFIPDNGHYFANGRFTQLLPSGDRAQYTVASTSLDVRHLMRMYRTSGATNGLATAIDANFPTTTITRYLDPTPPTALYSGRQATLLHYNLIQINSANNGPYTTSGNWAQLQGADSAKTYNLLRPNSFLPRAALFGYALNNTRGSMNDRFQLNINSFTKNGIGYYHNAMFYAKTNEVNVFAAKIDASMQPNGMYNCSSAVYTTMESFITDTPVMAGYTDVEASDWLIVPPYPDIGFDYAMYKVMMSWKIADNTVPLGYRWSGMYVICGIAPATYTKDSLDNYVLQSIDMSAVNRNWALISAAYMMQRSNSRMYGASAWEIGSDRFYGIVRGGAYGIASHSGSTNDGWRLQAFSCDLNGSNNTVKVNSPGYIEQPVSHALHGIGIITPTEGIGTFYAFIPMLKPTMVADSDQLNMRILSSARPAAGFNYTITAPINVYVDGKQYTIPVQTINLAQITSGFQNATFNCYVQIFNGVATWVTTKENLDEHSNNIFVGKLTTTATEIATIDCRPVSRWEIAHVSPFAAGTTIAVSGGTAASAGSAVWSDAHPLDIVGSEYLWDSDDIVNKDPANVRKDIVININSDWNGTNVMDSGFYIKRGFMVANYIREHGLDLTDVKSLTVNIAANVALVGGFNDQCNYGIDFGDELVGIPKTLNVDGTIFGAGGSRFTQINGWSAIRGTVGDTVPLKISLNANGWICGGGGAGEGNVNQGYAYSGGGAPYGRGFNGGGNATLTIGGPQNNPAGHNGGDVGRPGAGASAGQPGNDVDVGWIDWLSTAGHLGP